MGNRKVIYSPTTVRGLCVRCKAPFAGKGDRCQRCADELRQRQRRRPR